jgi:CRP-like cAMP-binding protein
MDLSNFVIFKGLSANLISDFGSACATLRYKAGVDIITKGEKGDLVYFVLKGRVQVFLPDGNGDEGRVLAELDPGAVFGEMELLTDTPRRASVRARTNVKLWAISFDTLRAQGDDGDVATLRIMFNIAKILAHRLGAMDDKLSEIGEGREEVRVEELRAFKRKLFSEWDF